jgi:hypothetical protein
MSLYKCRTYAFLQRWITALAVTTALEFIITALTADTACACHAEFC